MFKRIDVSLGILLVLAAAVALIAFVRDRSLPMAGLYASGRLLGSVWIELLLGFIIAGFLEVLVSPAQLAEWVGGESSMKGILIGWGVGLILPGGPYLLFPIAANLFRHGAAPGMLITLITAKTLVSPIRMLTYEAPLLGWPFTLARCAPALLLPPLMGLLGQWLFVVFTKK
jgi:uncharacterized membrane protein YraQ (UPF0718 family)